ncbi:MAG: shikimate dehydrogenase [Flavobacteriales bacterium]|nr:shikimate dehydrogenase [Flavobacteriales bacterium]
MFKLGLIGEHISHSLSKRYFDTKFQNENIKNFQYDLYDIDNLKQINELIIQNKIIGLNVTMPYKKKIIQELDELDKIALETQSVNTIFINPDTGLKKGFNTDFFGFEYLLFKLHLKENVKGLILGSGGVSSTISYVLKKHGIKHKIVSRKPKHNMLHYQDLDKLINKFQLIINTTPLGQYPNTKLAPILPYKLITNKHIAIDLIYNPEKTIFLQKMETKGAKTINGLPMLIAQADQAWYIWIKMIEKYNV